MNLGDQVVCVFLPFIFVFGFLNFGRDFECGFGFGLIRECAEWGWECAGGEGDRTAMGGYGEWAAAWEFV